MQIAINRLEYCLLDVSHWMAHNGLKLNNDKTEWLIFNGNPEISKGVTLTVGAETIKQSISIRNLGVRLEPDLTMLPHINDTCRSGYYHLQRINKIRKYISLVPVHGRSTQINKQLLNCGVSTTWNSLPKDLRIIKSFILFKKHLKTYLFNL